MGSTLSCCLCPNACRKRKQKRKQKHKQKCKQKRGRRSGSVESEVYEVAPQDPVAVLPSLAVPEPAELDFGAGVGNHAQQHISNPEMPEDSDLESNNPDDSKAIPFFLSASQMDDSDLESNPPDHPRAIPFFLIKSERDAREKEKNNHVWTAQLIRKYSSCSTIFLDDNTVRQPNLERTLTCVSVSLYYLIINRDGNKSIDIFDERSHPLTQEEVPEEDFEDGPDPATIYRFLHTLFSIIGLPGRFAIITWIYLENLVAYTDINICPNNWKRIVLGAILASRSCDSQSLQNICYCETLTEITLEDMQEIKKNFVNTLKHHLRVTASVYSKCYFEVRSRTCKSMPFMHAFLSKHRAQKLEAISGLCEDHDYNDLRRVAMRRSVSSENVIVFQRSNAIIP